jgi:hypothetical protein
MSCVTVPTPLLKPPTRLIGTQPVMSVVGSAMSP